MSGNRLADAFFENSKSLQRRLDLKAFRFDKTGEIAPRAVQKYLENKKIVIAIEKGLIILGY